MGTVKKYFILGYLLPSLLLAGCSNIFQGTSDTNTDPAKFEDAQKLMDKGDWDTALSKFSSMSADYQAKSDVIEAWSGAYAGKCGLNFIPYFASLGSASLTGSTPFLYLMNAWTDKVIYPSYCTQAQTKMEEIPSADRTTSQNFFLAVLGLVKIGTFLRNSMDTDGVNNLGDNTTDAPPGGFTYASCASSRLSDANLDEVITGLGLVMTNLTALTTVLGSGDISTALGSLNTICAALGGACSKTDASTVTAGDRTNFRELLSTGPANVNFPMGIETCNNNFVIPGSECCP